MKARPVLDHTLDSHTFYSYYYLKEELIAFCRKYHLPTSGGKIEISERIAHYLDTKEILTVQMKKSAKPCIKEITLDALIEDNFVCSEMHRAFFKKQIGSSFSFTVAFQQWLKANTGKTYDDAISAYHEIVKAKKKRVTKIDKQFEYNTYIRDFFSDNKGKTLQDAIACWKYKKCQQGHNRYESSDLIALDKLKRG
ncbi:hypothetical protein EDD63_14513 [Breznakia blatticola]|uniref:DUF6434 domain-containing protein n=1 Tax=Breznakia blatticola TaxID=1754012 RepID=A0A4R7Z9X4_9FIRM|nr:DUF6434 domain-containing protein [Breznakia blatticola]TDW13185.1 hypothetical protein EDD63_14513 [Breznakia blatticola]